MKNITVSLFFLATAISNCYARYSQELIDDEYVSISPRCAAVLLTSSATLGAGVAYTLPAAMCATGFCSTGVAGGSFASWWQSSIPSVVKGSLFAKLQAITMGGGVGTSSLVSCAAIGGTVGAGYLRDFCAYVDKTDSESAMGKVFDTSVTLANTAIETKEKVRSQCASSETCAAMSEAATEATAATVEKITSMWDSVTTGASNLKKRAYLNYEILSFRLEIEEQKHKFGALAFDHMRKLNKPADDSEIDGIYRITDKEVRALEIQIMEKKSNGDSTLSLAREVNNKKADFGTLAFDIMSKAGWKWNDIELENTFKNTLAIVTSLEFQIQDREAQLAELGDVLEAVTEAGATTVEKISSMWNSFTTGASNLKRRAYLNYEILSFSTEIREQKHKFGALAFDHMRKTNKYSYRSKLESMYYSYRSKLESMYMKSDLEVRALEIQIMEKESNGDSTWNLARKVNDKKAKFGTLVFDDMRKAGWKWYDVELENISKNTLDVVTSLELQIQDREAQLAELS